MTDPLLRALVDLRDRQIQKARIQFGNRLSAIENNADDPADSEQHNIVARWFDVFAMLENKLDDDIAKAVKKEPMFEEMKPVKGIGPTLSAKLIAMIDIERANTVSALWRYAGYAVIDGQRERLVKGETAHYNKRLKTTMFLVAASFMKCNSPYRIIYDRAKAKYEETKPDWTPKHIHLAATRKMNKMFLSHLWERWRLLEGLPVREHYAKDYLDHQTVYKPEEFGWK